jgi:uncharacterized protein (DUF305 family)
MKPTPRRLVFLASAVAIFTLGACSSSSSESDTSDTSGSPASTTEFNDDDVMFAQMMIPHHEQAIELSDIALDPSVGSSDEVRSLASSIKSAQDPEIDQMTALLASWGQPLTADPNVDHGSMMKGMLSVEELDELGALTGTEFDRAWLGAMIAHHEGAVAMAEAVLDTGLNVDIAKLAADIVAMQEEEIDMMLSLLES